MAKQTENLEELRVADLRERAKDAGVTGTSHMRKDELVEALHDRGAAEGANGTPVRGKQSDTATDILALLEADHQKVKALFDRALTNEEEDDDAVAALAAQIIAELDVHTQAEEQIFYPALKAKATDDGADEAKDGVVEAYVEHGSVKELIAKLQALEPNDESYRAILTVMREQVEHHIEEEESEMFGNARRLLSKEELAQIGGKVADFKASSTVSAA